MAAPLPPGRLLKLAAMIIALVACAQAPTATPATPVTATPATNKVALVASAPPTATATPVTATPATNKVALVASAPPTATPVTATPATNKAALLASESEVAPPTARFRLDGAEEAGVTDAPPGPAFSPNEGTGVSWWWALVALGAAMTILGFFYTVRFLIRRRLAGGK